MKSRFSRLLWALGWSVLWFASPPAAHADHRDATAVMDDPRTNINDVYAFVNGNSGNVVLVMTVNGYTAPGVKPVFAPGCLYQFKIDNTGDFVEDRVIQILFDKPVGPAFSPTQNFTVVGPIKPARVGAINTLAKSRDLPIAGPVNISFSNTFTLAANGVKVFCGTRDDGFFFDEVYMRNILRGTLAAPVPPQTRSGVPGIDYYAGLNCSAIAIELPVPLLTGTLTNPTSHQKQINVWATTSLPSVTVRALRAPKRGEPPEGRETGSKAYVQHDRAALACVSTFLVNEEDKNAFCGGQPKDDVKFFSEAARPLIQKLQLNPAAPASMQATTQALTLRFPDVLRLDVTSQAGVALENGRRPTDDVISHELSLLTVGALTTQNVPANDVPFLADFPFFAPPHTAHESVPARD